LNDVRIDVSLVEGNPVVKFERIVCRYLERLVIAEARLYERVVLSIAHPPCSPSHVSRRPSSIGSIANSSISPRREE
jgi:hypothetical protein